MILGIIIVHSFPHRLDDNAKTVIQTSNQTITVESMQDVSEDKELMQTSKTLQQRMLDLQVFSDCAMWSAKILRSPARS